MPDLSHFGPELRRLRERAGLSQRAACEAVLGSEMSQAMWSRWENGKQFPNLADLSKIASYFGVPIETFGVDPERRALTEDDIAEANRMLERARELVETASIILSRAESTYRRPSPESPPGSDPPP